MAENGNRGPNDFRSRNVRKRREPPIIDASATEVPVGATEPTDAGFPDTPPPSAASPDLTPAADEAAAARPIGPEPAEPVLFGGAMRDAVPKADVTAGDVGAPPAEETPEVPIAPPEDEAHAPSSASPVDAVAYAPDAPASSADRPEPGTVPPRRMPPPAAASGGLAPWLLSLAIFGLLGALAWLLYTEPRRSGRDEIAALQSKVAELEARADPAQALGSVAALDQRVAAADAERAGLAKSVAGLTTRLDAVAQDARGAKDEAQGARDEARGAKAQAEQLAAAPPPAEAPKPADSAAPAFASLAAVAALSSKVDGIDDRLGGLTGDQAKTARTVADLPKPVPPDFGPVDAKLAALDGRLTELDGKVNGSDARFNGFDAKVNGVDGKINGFDARMNGLNVRMNGLEAKANDAAVEAGKLQSAVANLPKVDLAPLQATTSALDGKVATIEGQLSADKDGARVTEARAVGSADEAKATPIALVGQSIGRAIADGRPYGADLDALKTLGAEPDAVAKLSPLATGGAPTVAALLSRWDAERGDVLAAVKPAEAGNALDRFAASARALVQVRRVGAVQGDDPAALVSQVDAALERGDVPAALSAWNRLPQAGQDRSRDWAAAASGQVEAAGAAQALVTRSIATLGRAKS